MGRQQHGHPVRGRDAVQQLDDLLGTPRIEIRQGLVKQQQLGTTHECVGNQHALLFAARQLSDSAICELLRVNRTQHLVDVAQYGSGPT